MWENRACGTQPTPDGLASLWNMKNIQVCHELPGAPYSKHALVAADEYPSATPSPSGFILSNQQTSRLMSDAVGLVSTRKQAFLRAVLKGVSQKRTESKHTPVHPPGRQIEHRLLQ